MNQSNPRHRWVEVAIHVAGWSIVFGFPFLMMSRHGLNISVEAILRFGIAVPVSLLLVFYLNYAVLIPRYLFSSRWKPYLLANLLLICGVTVGLHGWQELLMNLPLDDTPRHGPEHKEPPTWVFMMRDFFSLLTTAGLSVAIKLSGRWMQLDAARKEAERRRAEAEQSRTEAELRNLRSQLNPHFLLNTLNNIYALIAFDADRAQTAVQELSRLLRHVLYDNQQPTVPLHQEMDFIRNYIELMRIRLTPNVQVDTDIRIAPDSMTPIAPLIYISLIENAFKHGISPTARSFISIHFSEDEHYILCRIRNSHHPKTEADKSGSGIGLGQVSKRLELTYPGAYSWQRGVSPDGKEYHSELIIFKQTNTPSL